MQFYKINGAMINNDGGDEMNLDLSENAYKVAARINEFNGADCTKCCFLSSAIRENATFGIIVTESVNLIKLAEKCAEFIGMSVKMFQPEEITLSNRREATVSRISLVSGVGICPSERGIWLIRTLVRPAPVKFWRT